MTTTDATFASLCAALDQASEADVPHLLDVLADLLEERGDERAAGLRRLRRIPWRVGPGLRYRPADGQVWYSYGRTGALVGRGYTFVRANRELQGEGRHALPPSVFRRLEGGRRVRKYAASYPTSHQAYLALAEALKGE